MIRKEQKIVTRTRVVEAARYRDEDTGEIEEVTIVDGRTKERRIEQRPVKQRILVPAKFVEEARPVDVWVIEHKGETHEFGSEEDAVNYAKTVR